MIIHRGLAILIVVSALCLPAYADRGKDAYKKGERAEHQSNLDAAVGFYKEAFNLAPGNATYIAAYTRTRFTAYSQHVHAGQVLFNTGKLPEAMAEFQIAVDLDASSFVAQQELRRTAELIRRQERQKSQPKPEAPSKLPEQAEILELKPFSNSLINMHLTANADVAYKTICKLAGINVVIDPEFRAQKITIDLTDVTLREALDMVRLQSKSFWRPVLQNTIFVTADNAAKRKELEQNVMKTFYLQNITTPAELTEAGNMVRQLLDISRIQPIPGQDALILRGTPDQMILAEKLLADYDKPKSEVVIDVAVLQVSRDRIKTIGTTVPTSASIGYVGGAIGASTQTGGNSSGGYTGKIGNFAISIPGGSFTFLASDSNTKILQNPEIRALNGEKATLRIGDRVPIATGSFQPGLVGGAGVSPLVSTQFQYLDVGVNIDITPHIHSDKEVTLKMVLEISSVTGSETIGGITQPVIGQRRIEHETRLVDGEVNLLGGILDDTETQSMSGYPWISRLPILKYLFAQDNREKREDEIIFAITPHIVRAREITEENLRSIEVGTGSSTELRRKAAAPAATGEHAADPAKPQPSAPKAAPASGPAAGSASPGTPSQASPPNKPGATTPPAGDHSAVMSGGLPENESAH